MVIHFAPPDSICSFLNQQERENRQLVGILAETNDTFSTDDSSKGLSNAAFRLWRNQQLAVGELMTVSDGNELFCMGHAAFCHKHKDEIDAEALEKELNRDTDPALLSRTSHRQEHEITPSHHDSTPELSSPLSLSQEFRNWFRPLILGVNIIASEKVWQFEATRNPLFTRGSHSREKVAIGDGVPDQRMERLQHLLLDLMEILDLEKSGVEGANTDRCHRALRCDCTKCHGTEACPCPARRKNRCRFAGQGSREEPQASSLVSWQRLRDSWAKGPLAAGSPA